MENNIIKSNNSSKDESMIYKMRHSLAHILAQAVLEIRPDAKLGFGPPIDTGFYYDFDFGAQVISETDLEGIEKNMKRIIKEKQPFHKMYKSLPEAIELLNKSNQFYKIEYAKELVESERAKDGLLSFYINGPFIDMCEGPHLEHTGQVFKGCFKLDRISGSYWRGDEKRKMLTRIYGLAFEKADELKNYMEKRKLAIEHDHRKLGSELDIFVLDKEVGIGLPLWLPNGTVIKDELEKWAYEEEFKTGYQRVSTPVITRSDLYHKSGHLPYFAESMFPPMTVDENDQYYLRPMNCPHHHKIFAARPKSYRELPFKIAEYGNTFRYEKHGSLSGLLRVRSMSMNDAHIYCEYSQVKEEFQKVIEMYKRYYEHLRIGKFNIQLSLHDSNSDKFVKNENAWQNTEQIVREILLENNIEFTEAVGDAAFYGPKMDIQIKNILGREETVSTCQLDFVMAEKFNLTYVAKDGSLQHPFIIHRAPLSTHERLISFLIEFYGGAFPTWLAPVQVKIIPVSEHSFEYAKQVHSILRSHFFRANIDDTTDTFNRKIRNGITQKIPNLWIIGNAEVEKQRVTWRRYCTKIQSSKSIDDSINILKNLTNKRLMDNFEDVTIF